MDKERILEIHNETIYPDSISVHNALLTVWKETAKPGDFKCEDCVSNPLRLAMQKGILNTDTICDTCMFNPRFNNLFLPK